MKNIEHLHPGEVKIMHETVSRRAIYYLRTVYEMIEDGMWQ